MQVLVTCVCGWIGQFASVMCIQNLSTCRTIHIPVVLAPKFNETWATMLFWKQRNNFSVRGTKEWTGFFMRDKIVVKACGWYAVERFFFGACGWSAVVDMLHMLADVQQGVELGGLLTFLTTLRQGPRNWLSLLKCCTCSLMLNRGWGWEGW